MHVIIADHDPTMAALLRGVVEREGHTVVSVVADGEAAWNAFQQDPVPLMIVDWVMPRLDGLGLCRRIRESELGDPFLLVVTGRDGKDDLLAALDAGADDYITKPVGRDELAARLRIAERRIEITGARKQAEALATIVQQAKRIGEVVKRLRQIEQPRSVEYLGDARMLDISPGTKPKS
jgi:DNA-binding response OmpR family regulator